MKPLTKDWQLSARTRKVPEIGQNSFFYCDLFFGVLENQRVELEALVSSSKSNWDFDNGIITCTNSAKDRGEIQISFDSKYKIRKIVVDVKEGQLIGDDISDQNIVTTFDNLQFGNDGGLIQFRRRRYYAKIKTTYTLTADFDEKKKLVGGFPRRHKIFSGISPPDGTFVFFNDEKRTFEKTQYHDGKIYRINKTGKKKLLAPLESK